MVKKTTLNELGSVMEHVVKHMATKEDLADLKKELKAELASKADLFALQTQVSSIENDIRSMKQSKLEFRVADLEEKVFGKVRA
jgi:hypothetical protein